MYSKILIATDGSETASKAVERGVEVAGEAGAKVWLLAVASPARARAVLDAAVAGLPDSGVQIETVVEEGDPASVILDTAEAVNADLVVVGNKGMQGGRRFLLGSVPNKVSRHAPCAVLIVKTT